MNDIKRIIASDSILVADALQRMEENARGILFLVNDSDVVSGCITDGDIRRFLLAGGKISAVVLDAANRNPNCAKTLDGAKQLYQSDRFAAIPIIDESGKIRSIYFGGDYPVMEKSRIGIPVVINAGGKGTRLDPITKIIPKPLVPIGDYPIIEHIMKEFNSYSCNDFHIILNYKRELVKAYYSDNERQYNICWYDEESPLGTGGGLYLIKNNIKDTFFFVNCDSLLKADYADILKKHRENHNLITMVCAYKSIKVPYGVVDMGDKGEIKTMQEKPTISLLTNTGLYIVEPEVLQDIDDNTPIDFTDVVMREKEKGGRVAVYPVNEDEWLDMGQFPELNKMRLKLSEE